MSSYQFFLLASMVYIAPNMSPKSRTIASIVCIGLAVALCIGVENE